MATLSFLGGSGAPGSSAHLLEVAGVRLCIDAGGDFLDPYPSYLRKVGRVDGVLVTHAHFDHMRHVLDIRSKRGVFATSLTVGLGLNIIIDSLNRQQSLEGDDFESFYANARSNFNIVQLGELIDFGNGVTAYAINAGHIPGAVMWVVLTPEGNFLFQGNASLTSRRFVRSAEWPEDHIHYLVAEATYGDRNHEPAHLEMNRMITLMNETAEDGGIALYSAFSTDRISLLVHDWLLFQRSGLLNPDVDVYFGGGMAKLVSDVLSMHATELDLENLYNGPFYPFTVQRSRDPGVKYPMSLLDGAKYLPAASHGVGVVRAGKPAFIAATPGMMQAGLSRGTFLALNNSPLARKSVVVFTGYLEQTTFGHLVNSLGTGAKLPTESGDVEIKTRVEKFNFSAHLDQTQQLYYIQELDPDCVFYVHGEDSARAEIASLTEGREVVLPNNGDSYTLDPNTFQARRTELATLAS